MKNYTLYKVNVTEHEWEAGWGSSTRSDGIAFHEDRDTLIKYFYDRRKHMDSLNKKDNAYQLYETIDSPVLVRVTEETYKIYLSYLTDNCNMCWVHGDTLKNFLKGVEL